jgi:hypothetical protein
MSDPETLLAGPDRCVTASDLVRQFGMWQERALQQPLFVLRRGRPSLVLTSLDLMRRLCDPHDRSASEPLANLLLDAMREVVFITDEANRIVQVNRAGRIAFPLATPGTPLSASLPEPTARLLGELADRARRVGAADQAEVSIAGRQITFAIVPMGDGALYVGTDISADVEAGRCAARLTAFDEAIDLFDAIAWARITPRGYIEATSATLTRMTGIEGSALCAARFVTLVEPGARGSVAEAIEAVIADGLPRRLDVALTPLSAPAFSAQIALSAERSSRSVTGVVALVHASGREHPTRPR